MTADEAKQALKDGKKIRHEFWHDGVFLREETHIITNTPDKKTKISDSIFEEMEDDIGWEIVE